MLIKPDCIPCILKMVQSAVRHLTDNEELMRELTIKILQIPALRGLDWSLPSPEVVEPVMDMVMETFHTDDPFRTLKEEQNAKGLELYPRLKQLVAEATDPLFAAVNLAIRGNAIDVMISDHLPEIETKLERDLDHPIAEAPFLTFRRKLEKSRRLLYLGDNSCEVVFDKVLIETIRALYDPQVFFVVRGVPALNDVTLKEAREVGMDQSATLISNGMKKAVPGTILSHCSSELRELIEEADLIISKGGGNFDSLEEEKNTLKNISFMLLCKCYPYSRYFQVPLYQPILSNFYG